MKQFTIGRARDVDIVINDTFVSRKHAILRISDKGLASIIDLNSKTGVYVNGRKITGEYFLKPNDVVRIGKTTLPWQSIVKNNLSTQYYSDEDAPRPLNVNLSNFRHPKEKFYSVIIYTISTVIYLNILSFIIFSFILSAKFGYEFLLLQIGHYLLIIGLIVFVSWLIWLYYKAIWFGNAIHVNSKQYPKIYNIVKQQSSKLGIKTPEIFIYNGNGVINAFAIKILSKKNILLLGELVDLMLERGKYDELAMVIGHELGHHYAGHTDFWLNLFKLPSKKIPFLGPAYSRACELTADRVGLIMVENLKAAQNALISTMIGSKVLSDNTNIKAFMMQEHEIPALMGFIHKIFSNYPRMTKRIIELQRFSI